MKSFARTFSLLLVVTFAYNCYSQRQHKDSIKNSYSEILLKEEWVTDHILGLNPNCKKYKLSKYNSKRKIPGYELQFLDSSTFQSGYTPKCGNGMSTLVLGKYKLLKKNKIAITVETVTYSGEWTKPTKYRETKYLTFSISLSGDTIILKKRYWLKQKIKNDLKSTAYMQMLGFVPNIIVQKDESKK